MRVEMAWKDTLRTRSGRRLIYDLLAMCHYGLSPFAGEDSTTNFISGKQKVGEGIMAMVSSLDPKAFPLMITEAMEDQENDNRNARDADASRSDDPLADASARVVNATHDDNGNALK